MTSLEKNRKELEKLLGPITVDQLIAIENLTPEEWNAIIGPVVKEVIQPKATMLHTCNCLCHNKY